MILSGYFHTARFSLILLLLPPIGNHGYSGMDDVIPMLPLSPVDVISSVVSIDSLDSTGSSDSEPDVSVFTSYPVVDERSVEIISILDRSSPLGGILAS